MLTSRIAPQPTETTKWIYICTAAADTRKPHFVHANNPSRYSLHAKMLYAYYMRASAYTIYNVHIFYDRKSGR